MKKKEQKIVVPPVSKLEWVWMVLLTAVTIPLWVYGYDIDINKWCMENLRDIWQHIFSLLSTAGQGSTQLTIALLIALCINFYHHRSLKKLPLDAMHGLLSVFAFWARMFGWKNALETSWQHVMKAPRVVRIWVTSVPIFLFVGLLAYPIKAVIGRPRPKMLAGHDLYAPQMFEWTAKLHAYPSGHTITTVALMVILWLHYDKPWQKWLIAVIAAIVALARVGIGSHWMGDVLFGAALGYGGARYFMWRYQNTLLKNVLG